MPIIGKVWGTTECLLETPFVAIHRLKIKPEHECSNHVHRRKWNAFHVQSGSLEIHVTKNDYPLTDVTVLGPGDLTTVRPGEHHFFRTGPEGCECVEIYYPDALSEDIDRKGHGGPVRG